MKNKFKKEEEEELMELYHYKRGGRTFTTPNLQLAIARNEEENLTIETIDDGISKIRIVKVDHE